MLSKSRNSKIKLSNEPFNFDSTVAIIPDVDNEEINPKVKIYDPVNDGSYYFRKIGFNRKITDED